jgi:glycosyltransferase involved in cell wall biosynthesis
MSIRVLQIIHTLGHGGAENIFRWLSWQLKNEGLDVVGAVPVRGDSTGSENWVANALEEVGIDYMTYDKRGGSLDLLRSMTDVIRRTGPDIVHSHLLDSNFYSSIACRILSVPHVCTEHGDVLINHSPAGRLKFFLLSRNSRAVVCVSNTVRSAACRKGFRRANLEVIHNGIRFPEPERSTFREEFGIPEEALLIGNVANLYPVKGQRVLLFAFEKFLKEFPDSYLVLVGRGSEKENLESLARRLEIPETRFILTGFRGDVGNILYSMDVYVQPSLSEGLPVALLEAMSCGIPVVATDVGGVHEVLNGSHHGVLIPPGSWEFLFEALVKMAGDIDPYRRMAEESRRHVRENFSLPAMARRYIETYERVLSL